MAWYGQSLIARLLKPFKTRGVSPEKYQMGADFSSFADAQPTYDVATAMSAYAGFPWVYAAVLRRASDVSRLPIRVIRGRGARARIVENHPFYRLIDQPSTKVTGRQFRAQMSVDYRISGNAYSLIIGEEPIVSLKRLHPARTTLHPDSNKGFDFVDYNGSGLRLRYAPDDVIIAKLPSWEDGPAGLYGTGAILPLHNDLTTDKRASTRAGEMAKRGRPDMIVSPSSEANIWTPDVRDQIKRQLNKLLSDGGALVVGSEMKMEIPTWSPRDMEFKEVRQLAREAVLAVTGVPPHMVGLPSANYALAERQEIIYYEGIRAEVEEMADQVWTPLIRRLYGRQYSIRFDLSGIAALQTVRTSALERVKLWVDLGANAAEAAEYEGLGEGPLRPELEEMPEARSIWTPAQLREVK